MMGKPPDSFHRIAARKKANAARRVAAKPAQTAISERRQQQISARRYQIGAAAMELFEAKGYHATTMSEIADRAGISVGLIYQYAPDKEGVLFLVLSDILEAYARELPKDLQGVDDPLLAMRAAIFSYCRVVAMRSRAGMLGYREGKSLTREHQEWMKERELKTNGLIEGCISACIEAGYFRPLNVELMTYRIIMVAHTWALKSWRLSRIVSLEEYIADNIDFLFAGALTAAGRRRCRRLGIGIADLST